MKLNTPALPPLSAVIIPSGYYMPEMTLARRCVHWCCCFGRVELTFPTINLSSLSLSFLCHSLSGEGRLCLSGAYSWIYLAKLLPVFRQQNEFHLLMTFSSLLNFITYEHWRFSNGGEFRLSLIEVRRGENVSIWVSILPSKQNTLSESQSEIGTGATYPTSAQNRCAQIKSLICMCHWQ